MSVSECSLKLKRWNLMSREVECQTLLQHIDAKLGKAGESLGREEVGPRSFPKVIKPSDKVGGVLKLGQWHAVVEAVDPSRCCNGFRRSNGRHEKSISKRRAPAHCTGVGYHYHHASILDARNNHVLENIACEPWAIPVHQGASS
jgi:hypothetical protein